MINPAVHGFRLAYRPSIQPHIYIMIMAIKLETLKAVLTLLMNKKGNNQRKRG